MYILKKIALDEQIIMSIMVLHGSNQLNYNVENKKKRSLLKRICIYSPRGVPRYRYRDRCMKKSNMGDDIGC